MSDEKMPCTCWRKHSSSFAKGESCPRDIETLQAAWDRDQELIEEQRLALAKKSETINQLRQQIESLKASRKAVCVELPDPSSPGDFCVDVPVAELECMKLALDKAGVAYK